MRIALFAWESLHAVALGGVAVYGAKLAAALARAGHETHLFTRLGPGQRLDDIIDGVRYHRVPWRRREDFVDEVEAATPAFMHYFAAAASADGPFDWVHAQDWLGAPMAFEARRKSGAKLAATLHGTAWGRSGRWPDKGPWARIAAWEGALAAEADALFVVSGRVRRLVRDQFHPPSWKQAVVRHGVDVALFDAVTDDPAATKGAAGIDTWTPTVVYAGAGGSGALALAEAWPRVLAARPDAVAVFIGADERLAKARREAERLGLNERTRWLGNVTGRALAAWHRAADLVASPEGDGRAALSAWAAAKPVLAVADAGWADEIVVDGVTGMLVGAEAFGAALADAFGDFDRLRWMGANGRVAADTAFTWDRAAEETLSVYARRERL